jgi:hypothetical protein
VGTIVKDGDVLRVEAADVKYRLDSQREAKKYEGKDDFAFDTLTGKIITVFNGTSRPFLAVRSEHLTLDGQKSPSGKGTKEKLSAKRSCQRREVVSEGIVITIHTFTTYLLKLARPSLLLGITFVKDL